MLVLELRKVREEGMSSPLPIVRAAAPVRFVCGSLVRALAQFAGGSGDFVWVHRVGFHPIPMPQRGTNPICAL
jgi:hypothetical protein